SYQVHETASRTRLHNDHVNNLRSLHSNNSNTDGLLCGRDEQFSHKAGDGDAYKLRSVQFNNSNTAGMLCGREEQCLRKA
ncbi:hypothetical protein A2U01_0053518, partial [Trifolium medium]|nr:hypothetical protein [Trifolium medium]